MITPKAKVLEKQVFEVQERDVKSLKPSQTGEIDPKPLLDSLKEKYLQFVKLRDEGFIDREDQSMEAKLRQTIEELEVLIPQLEESEI